MHTTSGLSTWLTPNYRSVLNDPERYNGTLATIMRGAASNAAAIRQVQYRRLALDGVSSLLDRAARAIADIIEAHPAPAPKVADKYKALALRGDAIVSTYARYEDLFEKGHLTSLDYQVASEILARAQQKALRLAGANSDGLALVDIELRDAVDAIKPLLATQTNIELMAA